MLMTMEHAYKEAVENMPNPERMDKVEESMDNLESVVRERNRAYFDLETGESGERERIIRPGPFGFDVGYVKEEHTLPRKYNIAYRKMLRYRYFTNYGKQVRNFHARFLEMKRAEDVNERM
jgi:large subunit ribosomal protein L47